MRLDDKQKRTIEKQAVRYGMSMSAYIWFLVITDKNKKGANDNGTKRT